MTNVSILRAGIIIVWIVALVISFWAGTLVQRAGLPGRAKRVISQRLHGLRSVRLWNMHGSGRPDRVLPRAAGLCVVALSLCFCIGVFAERVSLPKRLKQIPRHIIMNTKAKEFFRSNTLASNELNPVAASRLTTFSTERTQPILVLVDDGGAGADAYIGEILLAEGFNQFQVADLSQISPGGMNAFALIILVAHELTDNHVAELEQYVAKGGRLLAVKPDRKLSRFLGLMPTSKRLNGGYIRLPAGSVLAEGLIDEPVQFHGAADVYALNGAETIVYLLTDRWSELKVPGVTRYRHGDGMVVCFAYDILWSLMCLRQGNSSLAVRQGDGHRVARASDLFNNFLDSSRANIPQADVQQHLLSDLILELTEDTSPMPRWYALPAGASALLVMTGDCCGRPNKAYIERQLGDVEAYGGRMSLYLFFGDPPTITNTENARWIVRGHSTSIHPFFSKERLPNVRQAIDRDAAVYHVLYERSPKTIRMHWLRWVGYVEQARICEAAGISMDLTYVSPTGGYTSGSGLPMRFVDPERGLINVYQQPTQFEDDVQMAPIPHGQNLSTGEAIERSVRMLGESMDRYHTPVVMNIHPVNYVRFSGDWTRSTMAYAKDHGVPIWSAEQWLAFWEAREQAEFTGITFENDTLSFQIKPGQAVERMTVMVPACCKGKPVAYISVDSRQHEFSVRSVWGREYAMAEVNLNVGTILGVHVHYK